MSGSWRYGVVASSVLLAGTYVWWTWHRENVASAAPEDLPEMVAKSPAVKGAGTMPVQTPSIQPIYAPEQRIQMMSSKSGKAPPVFIQPGITPANQPVQVKNIAEQPASMPAVLSIGDGGVQPVSATQQIEMHGSTKWGGVQVLPKPEDVKPIPATQQRIIFSTSKPGPVEFDDPRKPIEFLPPRTKPNAEK